MIIMESKLVSASNNDYLSAPSRLTSIPFAGRLTLAAAASVCTATNNLSMTIQTPDGELPFEKLIVPANGYDTSNMVMHDATELVVPVAITPDMVGGHVLVSFTLTGTATAYVVATLVG